MGWIRVLVILLAITGPSFHASIGNSVNSQTNAVDFSDKDGRIIDDVMLREARGEVKRASDQVADSEVDSADLEALNVEGDRIRRSSHLRLARAAPGAGASPQEAKEAQLESELEELEEEVSEMQEEGDKDTVDSVREKVEEAAAEVLASVQELTEEKEHEMELNTWQTALLCIGGIVFAIVGGCLCEKCQEWVNKRNTKNPYYMPSYR